MKLSSICTLSLAAILSATLPAQAPIAAQSPDAAANTSLVRQLDEARQQIAAQAALLAEFRGELARQAQAIEQLRGQQRPVLTSFSPEDVAHLQQAVLLLRSPANSAPAALLGKPAVAGRPAAAQDAALPPADLFFRIGHAKLTPGGYIDFTNVYRSTNVGSGVGTNFQSIPFNNTTQGGLSEYRLSSQGSRLSIRFDESIGKTKAFGFAEADFYGTLPGNAYVSTNSNTFRMRVYYLNLARNRWEMLGGQGWSLLTPTRKALSPLVSDLFITSNIDTGYQAGLVYARQAQIRFVYHASPLISAGVSIENPEQFAGSAVTFPSLFSNTELDINSSSGSGGATATPNLHPDIVAKLTFDKTVAGRFWHAGVAGLLTSTRIVTPASVTKTVAAKDSREGAGVIGNLNLELFHGFRLISTSYWSDGGARYMGGMGPGAVVLQNGTATSPFSAALIHSGSGIGGFEWAVSKRTTVSAFGSAAWFQRRYGLDPSQKTATYIGYGFPGSANTNNRIIKELSFASTTTLWQNPTFGALQFMTQSSYVLRAPWYIAPGAPRDAHTMMEFVNLRYVIP
ncbi:MAG: hypothetical protein P4K83_05755 [Terracidiphilus sp.]|nr:hypothetical protein [Terracidiphilus sp.]